MDEPKRSTALVASTTEVKLEAVRLALGLPVVDALAVEAAKKLLAVGVTAADLAEKGYPQPMIDALREAAAAMIARV